MEDSPTFHVALAIELIDSSLPPKERWNPSNFRMAKVIDAAPYRKDQFKLEDRRDLGVDGKVPVREVVMSKYGASSLCWPEGLRVIALLRDG
jgi:hypothetical protein